MPSPNVARDIDQANPKPAAEHEAEREPALRVAFGEAAPGLEEEEPAEGSTSGPGPGRAGSSSSTSRSKESARDPFGGHRVTSHAAAFLQEATGWGVVGFMTGFLVGATTRRRPMQVARWALGRVFQRVVRHAG